MMSDISQFLNYVTSYWPLESGRNLYLPYNFHLVLLRRCYKTWTKTTYLKPRPNVGCSGLSMCWSLFSVVFFQILTVFHFLLLFLLAVHQLCSISDTLRIVFCHVTSMCLLNSSFVFILAYQLVKSARAWLSSDFSNLNCLLCCCS